MQKLNDALKLAVEQSDGDAQLFALLLTAPLAGWMVQGFLDEDVASRAIALLHQLHPDVKT